jgi:YebC/PmpR family DNA-binding regulatory protein
MSGHNKWSKIKHKKGAEDAKRSNLFSKLSRQIIAESKAANGDLTSPSLIAAIDAAKKENMPKDTIERAIKKGTDKNTVALEPVTYEAYGPGGTALIIEGLTDNKNRSAAEIRHALSKRGIELAAQGAAAWAFTKEGNGWVANSTVDISEEDGEKLGSIIDELEEIEDVQEVFSNAN